MGQVFILCVFAALASLPYAAFMGVSVGGLTEAKLEHPLSVHTGSRRHSQARTSSAAASTAVQG